VETGDNCEFDLRSRQARREGLFYLGCIAIGLIAGLALRIWL
jgi:hypothetical protein